MRRDVVAPLCLALIVASTFALRYLLLSEIPVLTSADYGNYLTEVDILQGYDVRGDGLRNVPLFFLLLGGVLRCFDEFTALKLVASLVFSVAAVPFYALARAVLEDDAAALISTWLFISFEWYAAMIAWGGNPNFLGFAFLLSALLFLVRAFEDPSWRRLLGAGLCMSLVVGTHVLVTLFMFAALGAYTLLTLVTRRGRRSLRALLLSSVIGSVLSVPYAPIYLIVATHSLALIRVDVALGMDAVLRGLTWIVTEGLLTTIITVLGLSSLVRYVVEDGEKGTILLSLLIVPVLLALVTEHHDRWLYFLPIPVMLCFGLYLRRLIATARRGGTTRRLFALGFILTVCTWTTIAAAERLALAVEYFPTIGEAEIQAMEWIKDHTRPDDVFITSGPNRVIGGDVSPGNAYGWWVEGFAKRKCLMTGLAKWFTFADERQEARAAQRVFAGSYVVETGTLRVAEAYPASMNNPELAVRVDGEYHNLLFLNDAELPITFGPAENPNVTWHDSPFYAGSKARYLHHGESAVNVTVVFEWERLRVVRTVLISELHIDLVFRLHPRNAVIRGFDVNIWGSFFAPFEGYTVDDGAVTLAHRLSTNRVVRSRVALLATDGTVEALQVLPRDPRHAMPVVVYALTPHGTDLQVTIRITPTPDEAPRDPQPLQAYHAHDLLQQLEVDYVFLSKGRTKELHSFLAEPTPYATRYENDEIIILQVR